MTDELLDWFCAAGRDLPWRKERTPYRIWVSEVMLQQTQVATVIPYFERWLARFPGIRSLAAAPLDEVLKLWEGLGYYRRARLLHQAAQVVVNDYGGELPASYHELLKLPGIGPYTAAAVASLAAGEPVLAVDGNVKRVAARLFALPGVISEKQVRDHLTSHLPAEGAGAFNEALMELGETVCTPRSPTCGACPLPAHCRAFQTGRDHEFPNPRPKKAVPRVERLALIHVNKGKLWLEQRPTGGMLGGLWGFPLTEERQAGDTYLPTVKHAYTHFKIEAVPTLRPCGDFSESGDFFDIDEIAALALSKLDHKILTTYLNSRRQAAGSEPSLLSRQEANS